MGKDRICPSAALIVSLLADCRQGRSPVSNEALAYSAGTSHTADSRWRRYRTAFIFVFTDRPAQVERDLLSERLVHSRSRRRRLRSSKIPVLLDLQMDLGVVEPESGDSLAGEPGAASRAQGRLWPVLKTWGSQWSQNRHGPGKALDRHRLCRVALAHGEKRNRTA